MFGKDKIKEAELEVIDLEKKVEIKDDSMNAWIALFHASPATNANAVVINAKIVSIINLVTSFAIFLLH